jgi:hypothetical protein
MQKTAATRGVPLTSDLTDDDAIPYFLWDAPMTMRELRERLERSEEDRVRLLGRILSEAREPDVWSFTTPDEVSRRWTQLERYLGRRRDFWEFLLTAWREQNRVR